MKKDFIEFATNWWATKIEATENENEANLNLFKKLLYNKLLSEIIQKSSVLISTINCQNYMLDELVYISGIFANIPSGFEMRIVFENVWVYDTKGILISCF